MNINVVHHLQVATSGPNFEIVQIPRLLHLTTAPSTVPSKRNALHFPSSYTFGSSWYTSLAATGSQNGAPSFHLNPASLPGSSQ